MIRLLTLDIETKPNKVYTWGTFNQNIALNQIIESSGMICFAARFLGESKMHFHSVHSGSHKKMVTAVRDLLDECDGLITYNGISFDVPIIRWEILKHRLQPPSGFKQIDLYRTMKTMKMTSRKLDYVSGELGIGQKTTHEGMPLWTACMKGDPRAWKLMEKYNKNDVALTEKLFGEIQDWIPNLPREPNLCKHEHKQKRGYYMTAQSVYQRYRCNNCGSWMRDKKPIFRNSLVAVDGHRSV